MGGIWVRAESGHSRVRDGLVFSDGTKAPLSVVEYPLGHRKRRKEGIPVVMEKFEKNVARVFAPKQRDRIMAVCLDQGKLEATPVNEFMDLLAL